MMKNPLTEASVFQQDVNLCSSFTNPNLGYVLVHIRFVLNKIECNKSKQEAIPPPNKAILVFLSV